MRVFLGAEGDESDMLSELATSHWHGLISVPLNVKISFLSSSSSYRYLVNKHETIMTHKKWPLDILISYISNNHVVNILGGQLNRKKNF